MNPRASHATKSDAITRGVGTSCDMAHQLRWGLQPSACRALLLRLHGQILTIESIR
jgi:hypothetical protein